MHDRRYKWLPSEIDTVAGLLREGLSSRGIAERTGKTRGTINSIVKHNKILRAIGFKTPSKGGGAAGADSKLAKWSHDDRESIADMLRTGARCGDIMPHFPDKTRSALVSLVHRDPVLRVIGFKGKILNPGRRSKARKSTVIAFRSPRRAIPEKQTPSPQSVEGFKPRVINNVPLMIDDWIAKNGVRQFERGATGEFYGICVWLRARGYECAFHGQKRGYYTITASGGRAKKLDWKGVLALHDKVRRAEGLEPVRMAG